MKHDSSEIVHLIFIKTEIAKSFSVIAINIQNYINYNSEKAVLYNKQFVNSCTNKFVCVCTVCICTENDRIYRVSTFFLTFNLIQLELPNVIFLEMVFNDL